MKTRREFLRDSGMAVAGGVALAGTLQYAEGLPNGKPIGFQTFEIFKNLTDDWQGTWNAMAAMGYKFADLDYFGPIAQHNPDDINQTMAKAGLTVEILHLTFNAYDDDKFGASMGVAHGIKGVKTVMVTGAGGRASGRGGAKVALDDWKWLADQLNSIAPKVQKEGFAFGYHNHNTEFIAIDGKVPWDLLMESTDKKLVKFQYDVGNATYGGADALKYLNAYSDRYLGLHVKDFKPGMAAVPVGDGVLDWKAIFATCKKAKITNFVAEVGAYGQRSLNGDPLQQSPMNVMELFKASADFLKAYKS